MSSGRTFASLVPGTVFLWQSPHAFVWRKGPRHPDQPDRFLAMEPSQVRDPDTLHDVWQGSEVTVLWEPPP